ncbi:MAG: enoyl-CoA hydratase/isomerase family protein, partial [Pseudomonadota bacterium]|nr:enoyl-CoA hydratase/isomerase family protein [Pseudomonadota bacterium]
IQALLARVVGAHRAERLLVGGVLVEATEALAIGLVDELTGIDGVTTRARVWLEALLTLPRGPVLETRRIARRDVVEALRPERIDLPRFVAAWMQPDTQAGLRAMLARIGK